MSTKTNAARILDGMGIAYEVRTYTVDPEDLSAETVAAKVGMSPDTVYKTLVTRGDRTGPLFAVVPGDAELDLKALARVSGDRRVELVPLKEVQGLTGYVRGGVTVLGAKKAFPVVLEVAAEGLSVFAVSAGIRGQQLVLAPADYVRATGAKVGEIARR